jgi:hypothetical protein
MSDMNDREIHDLASKTTVDRVLEESRRQMPDDKLEAFVKTEIQRFFHSDSWGHSACASVVRQELSARTSLLLRERLDEYLMGQDVQGQMQTAVQNVLKESSGTIIANVLENAIKQVLANVRLGL